MNTNLSTLPAGALAALVVLAVVEITLAVIALVDLYRRPISQVVAANKWIWVAVIILASGLGPIIYLVAGRKPAALSEGQQLSGTPSVHTDSIADRLYGPRDGTDRR